MSELRATAMRRAVLPLLLFIVLGSGACTGGTGGAATDAGPAAISDEPAVTDDVAAATGDDPPTTDAATDAAAAVPSDEPAELDGELEQACAALHEATVAYIEQHELVHRADGVTVAEFERIKAAVDRFGRGLGTAGIYIGLLADSDEETRLAEELRIIGEHLTTATIWHIDLSDPDDPGVEMIEALGEDPHPALVEPHLVIEAAGDWQLLHCHS